MHGDALAPAVQGPAAGAARRPARRARVHAAYGLSRVLFGVSLEVARGECVCLLGRNGVGKTTTMRAIMGLTPPTAGAVRWQGRDVTGWAPNRAARSGVGFVPEDRRIFADLTVWENLEVAQRAANPPGPLELRAGLRTVPEAARAGRSRAAATCPAASSRCSPSRVP